MAFFQSAVKRRCECHRTWWGSGMANAKPQIQRFKEAARVIGGLANPKPPAPDQKPDADQAALHRARSPT